MFALAGTCNTRRNYRKKNIEFSTKIGKPDVRWLENPPKIRENTKNDNKHLIWGLLLRALLGSQL